jgi:N-formylglutamate amidohydrolase
MTDCYRFHAGDLPLLVSIPHDGRQVPTDIESHMSVAGKSLPDTDWHVTRLYAFARDIGASIISANYSRYVIDLNRPADDAALYEGQLQTGLCPVQTFSGEDIYASEPMIDLADRVARYWQPYHDKIAVALAAIRERHGYALLWDAHSIASRVPSLFEGQLPVLNLGTWGGRSCDATLAEAVFKVAVASPYDVAINQRFQGGHITRHYGRPDANVHAIQLELSQRAYMDESTRAFDEHRASQLSESIAAMLQIFAQTATEKAAIIAG